MNIKGVGPVTNILNIYNKNSKVEKTKEISEKDTIEISNEGRVLNNCSLQDIDINNDKKVEALREMIKNGTYNADSKLTAQSIVDAMKGRKI